MGLYNNLLDILSDGDFNVLSHLKNAINLSADDILVASDEVNKLNEAYALIEDCSYNLSKEVSSEHDTESIDEILSRLDTYQKLKRKFGGDTQSIIENYNCFTNELENLMGVDQEIIEIQNKLIKLTARAHTLADNLHIKRTDASLILSKELTIKIRTLKMVGATAEIRVSKTDELNNTGNSVVSFFAETNPGEGFYKIKERRLFRCQK